MLKVHAETNPPTYTIACGMHERSAKAHELRERPPEAAEAERVCDLSNAVADEDADGTGEPQPKVPALGERPRPSCVPPLNLTDRGIGGNARPPWARSKTLHR